MYANWVKETTVTAGTGGIATSAVAGWRRFSDIFAVGDIVYYTIQDGNNRETGIGTLAAGNTMARTTIFEKYEGGVTTQNPGTGINLSGGVAQVYIDVPKQSTFNYNAASIVSAPTTDVWNNKAGDFMYVTGNAAITLFGVPPRAGLMRVLFFQSTMTLVPGANMILPGGQNIVTANGDSAILMSGAGAQTIVLMYSPGNGGSVLQCLPLVGGTMQGGINFNNNSISGLNGVGWNSEYDNGNSGSALTINWANGQCQKVRLNAATPVLTINDPSVVGHYQLKIIQDATGGRNPTFAGGAYGGSRWIGSAGPPSMNTPANAVTFINFYYDGSLFYQAASAVNHT